MRRFTLIVLFGCLFFDSCGQFYKKSELFQVILADQVRRTGAKGIKPISVMDYLYKDDTIVVSKGGVLAMLHNSMYPVEITTDSVVVIRNLSKALDDYVKLSKGYGNRPMFEYLNISRLFAITPKEVRPDPTRIYATGAVHRGANQDKFELFYPPVESHWTTVEYRR